jgi:transcriptional regulator with XRE-family HTH domain
VIAATRTGQAWRIGFRCVEKLKFHTSTEGIDIGTLREQPGCMPPEIRKAYRRRKIGDALRRYREERGMTQDAAGRLLDRSASSLSAFENGHQSIRPRDLIFILDAYGVTDEEERGRLIALAGQGRQYGWWHDFDQRLAPGVLDFASLESDATRIRSCELYLIPGLLQTEDYARTVLKGSGIALRSTRDVEVEVEFRMRRQRILTQAAPPLVSVVVAEAALRQQMGGPRLMRRQLQRLCEVSELPHLDLRVLPFHIGAHPAIDGPFVIMDLGPEPGFQVVVMHTMTRSWYIDEPSDLRHYGRAFDQLLDIALQPLESRTLIERIVSEA